MIGAIAGAAAPLVGEAVTGAAGSAVLDKVTSNLVTDGVEAVVGKAKDTFMGGDKKADGSEIPKGAIGSPFENKISMPPELPETAKLAALVDGGDGVEAAVPTIPFKVKA